jgi:Flp pilus assembly protein TadG
MGLLRKLRDEDGGTLVEFTLAVTLLVTVVVGIMNAALAIYTNHFVSYAAAEASRYAMVRGSTWNSTACTTIATESCTATSANVTSLVQSITPPGIDAADYMTVTTVWTGKTPTGATCSSSGVNNSPGCVVQVKVSYSYSFFVPFLPTNAWQMTSTSAVVISQ